MQTLESLLEAAAEGLVYSSEGDAPFEYVEFRRRGDDAVTPETLRILAALPPDVPIGETTLERFFAGHIEESDPEDPEARRLVDRYRDLRELLRHALTDVRVFRAGTVEIRVYLIGRHGDDVIAGLKTTAWET